MTDKKPKPERGLQTTPHEFDRATVRALLSGQHRQEALGWVERHKANPSWLKHALSIEQARVFQREEVINAIKAASRDLRIEAGQLPPHFDREVQSLPITESANRK